MLELHPDVDCIEPAKVAAISLDLTAESRTWIVVGGTGPDDLAGVLIAVTDNP